MAHQDPEIAALRARFECVRITQMNGVDLARFDFDYDNTWQAFFLDADLNVYSRYGGRDPSSPEARLSPASLVQTMQEVLAVHERRQAQPAGKRVSADLHPALETSRKPEEMPLLKEHHSGCLHCHQVQEYRLLQSHADGPFDPVLLFPFPLPEAVGIQFDRNHGHRIETVLENSPAALAGIRAGDVIVRSGPVPVRSEEDFRFSLQRLRDGRQLEVQFQRSHEPGEVGAATPASVVLELPAGWRKGDVSWRKSLRSYPVVWGFLAYPLGQEERKTAGIPAGQLAIKVVSLRGQTGGLARILGLQKGDLIVALEADGKHRTLEQFKSEVLCRYVPGDDMQITVVRDGKQKVLTGSFPDWFTPDRSVP